METVLTDASDSEKIARAADILVTAYGMASLQNALAKARLLEAESSVKGFARHVREEVERRCSRSYRKQ